MNHPPSLNQFLLSNLSDHPYQQSLVLIMPDLTLTIKKIVISSHYGTSNWVQEISQDNLRLEIETNDGGKVLFHKTVYDFESLKKVMEEAGFKNFRRYDAKTDMPEGYDDFSMAYVPHMDPNGVQMCLNVVCEK